MDIVGYVRFKRVSDEKEFWISTYIESFTVCWATPIETDEPAVQVKRISSGFYVDCQTGHTYKPV